MISDKSKQRLDDAAYALRCAREIYRSICERRNEVNEAWQKYQASAVFTERYDTLRAEAFVALISAKAVFDVASNDYRKDNVATDGDDEVAS